MPAMDVMIDLETWGTAPNSAIRSIGARRFDLERPVDVHDIYSRPSPVVTHAGLIISPCRDEQSFYSNIDLSSCRAIGLQEDTATVQWWATQPEVVRAALNMEQQPIHDVLKSLHHWIKPAERVWSNGAGFDIVMLEWSFRACNIPVPWEYYNVRDTRTLKHAAFAASEEDARWPKQFQICKHHALRDADFQAFEAQHHWQIINRGWLDRLLAACRF